MFTAWVSNLATHTNVRFVKITIENPRDPFVWSLRFVHKARRGNGCAWMVQDNIIFSWLFERIFPGKGFKERGLRICHVVLVAWWSHNYTWTHPTDMMRPRMIVVDWSLWRRQSPVMLWMISNLPSLVTGMMKEWRVWLGREQRRCWFTL